MKMNGYPDRRYSKPPTQTHGGDGGKFSLCGAHFAPSDPTATVTCKRCLRVLERIAKGR